MISSHCLFVAFDYSDFTLTKQEVVYYYHRTSFRGICLTIIQEFDRVLKVGYYSLLPLIRPTASNALLKEQQTRDGRRLLDELRESSEILLTRPADRVLPNAEVISRNGLDSNTLDSFGEKALCRPFLQQTRNSLETILSVGTKRAIADSEHQTLKKMKVDELRQLAIDENVVLSADVKKRKLLIIDAIIEARRSNCNSNEDNVAETVPLNSSNDGPAGTSSTLEDDGVVVGSSVPQQECMELRVLRTYTKAKLVTMASKEKISLRGKTSKDSVVKAIYDARHGTNSSTVEMSLT